MALNVSNPVRVDKSNTLLVGYRLVTGKGVDAVVVADSGNDAIDDAKGVRKGYICSSA